MNVESMILKVYMKLAQAYGPQGWWPLVGHQGTNPTKTGAVQGYHVGDYSFPRTHQQKLEICIGAILTQNTAWPQVEKSLLNLHQMQCLDLNALKNIEEIKLKKAIKPSGYHNQKARYIRNFIVFFDSLDRRIPARQELLAQIGIGPETADSMLLYAFKQPEFVVDTYTKRIFSNLGIVAEKAKYDEIKNICQNALKKKFKDNDQLVIIYQEFHALLVEHAKRHYAKKPYGEECWLKIK